MGTIEQWVAFLTIGAMIYGAFAWVETMLRPERVKALGEGLANPHFAAATKAWRRGYVDWFDCLFKVKTKFGIPTPSLLRSASFSIGFAIFFFLLQPASWAIITMPVETVELSPTGRRVVPHTVYIHHWALFPVLLLSNFIFDYVSIIETRCIGRAIYRNRLAFLPFLLLIDLVVTFAMALCVSSMAAGAAKGFFQAGFVDPLAPLVLDILLGMSRELSSIPSMLTNPTPYLLEAKFAISVPGFGAGTVANAIFMTTVVTSVWLWLFLILGALTWLARKWELAWNYLDRHISVRNNPGKVLGALAVLLWTVVYWSL